LRAGTTQPLGAILALGLAFLVPQIPIGFEISTTRAIEMLVAVGAGTVAFIGIVYSLLFLVAPRTRRPSPPWRRRTSARPRDA
jgi:hypothetical protein